MNPILNVQDLTKRINHKVLFQGISFELLPGQSLGIFGTRGTGKTTLLHILAGVERFNSGKIEILGNNTRKSDRFKKDLGLVTQQKSLFQDMTVAENLDFIASLKKAPKATIQERMERFELKEYLKDKIHSLASIGVYQRLSLACALLNAPELLIADEILKDIDLYSQSIILRELEAFTSEGKTLICSFSHMADISSYPSLTQVGWLEDGTITFYDPMDAQAEWTKQVDFYRKQSERHHA